MELIAVLINVSSFADYYCFHCHKDRVHIACSICPRSYHYKCLPQGQQVKRGTAVDNWECPECIGTIEGAEEMKHSPTLSRISEEDFSQLLKFALGTIKQVRLDRDEPQLTHNSSSADIGAIVPPSGV